MARKAHAKSRGQKQLVRLMSAKGRRPDEKVIPFKNNDVPAFLKRLDRFEARSMRVNFVVS